MLHGCMNIVVRDKPRKKEGLDKIGLVVRIRILEFILRATGIQGCVLNKGAS